MITGVAVEAGDRPVFVFPGQGAQWVGMATALLESSPLFADSLRECADALAPHTEFALLDVLRDRDPSALDRADVVQPALFAVMVGLARLWQAHGVEPAAVVGHSQGEIAAAHVAGALTLPDAALAVAARSRVITESARRGGGMASVGLPADAVRQQIEPWAGTVEVAAINGPAATVVSGPGDALEVLVARWQADGVQARRITVDYASHCADVSVLRRPILDALAPITPAAFADPVLLDGDRGRDGRHRTRRRLLVPEPAPTGALRRRDEVPGPRRVPAVRRVGQPSGPDRAAAGDPGRGRRRGSRPRHPPPRPGGPASVHRRPRRGTRVRGAHRVGPGRVGSPRRSPAMGGPAHVCLPASPLLAGRGRAPT